MKDKSRAERWRFLVTSIEVKQEVIMCMLADLKQDFRLLRALSESEG